MELTCATCHRPIVWAHQNGLPAPFEESPEGRYLILNGVTCHLSDLQPDIAAMWSGARYENHTPLCKPKK